MIFQRPSGKYQSQFEIKQISFRILFWKDRISQVVRNVKSFVQFAKYIHGSWTSLVVEWLRLCLPMQETQIWALVKELGSHMRCGTTNDAGRLECVCVCAHARACICVHRHTHMLSCVWLFATPWTARLLCAWNFPSKNTGVCCHVLLQEIFLTQGSNPHLLHRQEASLPLESPGKPRKREYLCVNRTATTTDHTLHHIQRLTQKMNHSLKCKTWKKKQN